MAFRPNKSFRDIIDDLGLSNGLQLCLDAGDIASYDGTSQTWLDRGQGNDFFRGTTSGAQASDPTFNGTAGALNENEYFSFDGGDVFTLDTTNPDWVNSIHKSNAKFTLAGWIYVNALGLDHVIFGTNSGGITNIGYIFYVAAADDFLNFFTTNGAAQDVLVTTTGAVKTGWNFLAISGNEEANSATLQINGTQESFALTYVTPSAANATFTLQIGGGGNSAFPLPSGDRMGGAMMWNRSLSDAEMLSLYQYPGVVFSDLGGQRVQNRMVGY
jgi:Concanavalin A-like lectin/glucanases superfamily